MSGKDKPLPRPKQAPFGGKKRFGEGEKEETLLADQMAMAMAEGKLDEFLDKELPDSSHARKLSEMMMGMTGILPSGETATQKNKVDKAGPEGSSGLGEVPGEIIHAAQSGDVKGMMALLYREHKKRVPESEVQTQERKEDTPYKEEPVIDKETIHQMIKIAAENNVSQDWLLMRALKLYIQEYKKSGRL